MDASDLAADVSGPSDVDVEVGLADDDILRDVQRLRTAGPGPAGYLRHSRIRPAASHPHPA